MNTKYLLWEPPSSSAQSMKLKVYMCFSDNNNQDFINFFNAIGRKLNNYNQVDYFSANIPYRLQNLPNRENLLLLSELLRKHGNFCGDIMNPMYLEESANKKDRMCIFITGTNRLNRNEERLHSAATVYFSDKSIPSDSESSSASSNSMTFSRQKVLNVEAICAAPRNYVTYNGGRRMMALLVGACREMSIKNIYLNAINVPQTLNFYKSLGFEKTGETDDEENIEHRHESGMSNRNINTANSIFAMTKGTKLVNERKKRKIDERDDLKLIVETWTENDEQALDEINGVFPDLQHDLEVTTAAAAAAAAAEVGSKRKRGGGSNKRKRKSKKRKSKAQNSKTRARVS